MMEKDDFVLEMEKRFADYLSSKDKNTVDYTEWFIYGCQQYELEKEARQFLESNTTPTPRELVNFFDNTCPGGLAPGDDGADLLDDSEESATEFEIQMIDLLGRWFDYTKGNAVEDAAGFAMACEEQGLEEAALEFVQGREKLTTQDLWHWLARVQPTE